jgi:hypothetical protein
MRTTRRTHPEATDHRALRASLGDSLDDEQARRPAVLDLDGTGSGAGAGRVRVETSLWFAARG